MLDVPSLSLFKGGITESEREMTDCTAHVVGPDEDAREDASA